MNPANDPPPPPLGYAPTPPRHHRRSVRRWAGVIAALILIAAVGPWILRAVWRRASLVYWQQQCLTAPLPPGAVSSTGKLTVTMLDAPWQQLHTLLLTGYRSDHPSPGFVAPSENVLFRHALARPDGQQRLVVIAVGDLYGGRPPDARTTVATLYAHVVVPGTVGREPVESAAEFRSSQTAHVGLHPGDLLPPGTADPNDPTHFTITARRGTTDVAVNGWLKDDDTVVFDPRWVWMD